MYLLKLYICESWYACICVCKRKSIYMCIYICIYIYIYEYIHVYILFVDVCMYVFLFCHFILTPIYRSSLTSAVVWNNWQLSWFIVKKEYSFISLTNFSLKTVFILNYIFAFYHVVYILHSLRLWSVTSTYFQIRANVFYLFLCRLELKFSYSYSYFYYVISRASSISVEWHLASSSFSYNRKILKLFCIIAIT